MGGMRKSNSTGQMDGMGVDPRNFFWWPQYKCTPLMSVSTEHITALLMLWHLGFSNYSLLHPTLSRNKYTSYSRKTFTSFFSVLFSHIHLLSLLVFFSFLLPSFSLFLSAFFCFFLLYVWLLFVCWVCLSLSYFSFITQKCNFVESYKIWNFSETNLKRFAEREVDRLS